MDQQLTQGRIDLTFYNTAERNEIAREQNRGNTDWFCCSVEIFSNEARFPFQKYEVPKVVIAYVAQTTFQKLPSSTLTQLDSLIESISYMEVNEEEAPVTTMNRHLLMN